MITKPNTVLVATAIDTTSDNDSAVGSLVVINGETGAIVSDATALTGLNSIQFGVIKEAKVATGDASIKHPVYIAKTKAFKKGELANIKSTAFSAIAEDTFTLTLPGTMPAVIAGDVLHVKLFFKVDGHQTQKSEEYTFDLTQYTATATLATAIATRINANKDAWVTATVASEVVTVTAKHAIDYQPNAKSINNTINFNQVEFDLASYKVNGTSNYYSFGTVAKTVNATPGTGNPYVVRDQERAAFGYLGAMHSTTYPNIQPASSVAAVGGLVDATAQYDSISFTANVEYRSPDESYMKSTGVSAQVYYPHSQATAADSIVAAVKAWAGIA